MEPANQSRRNKCPSLSPTGEYSMGRKRMKFSEGKEYCSTSNVVDRSDPFTIENLLEGLNHGKFGSVTQEIRDLLYRRSQILKQYTKDPTLPYMGMDENPGKESLEANQRETPLPHDVIVLEDDCATCGIPAMEPLIINDDSDDVNQGPICQFQGVSLEKPTGKEALEANQRETPLPHDVIKLEDDYATCTILDEEPRIINDDSDDVNQGPIRQFQGGGLEKPTEEFLMKDITDRDCAESQTSLDDGESLAGEYAIRKDKGEYVGIEDDMEIEECDQQSGVDFDGLADIWKEMTVVLECSKDTTLDPSFDEYARESGEECDHCFLLKDDLGYVCRICGVIQRRIETIIEYQYAQGKRSKRTYWQEPKTTKDREATEVFPDGTRLTGHDYTVAEISAHPRHKKQMKPHQVEGFNFLLSNLVTDNPGGCILAHAPGSGKTFMIISFIQSFMAKYPFARPLVVLPRGILPTWKKEFQRWQVEDIQLYDFYSVKADSRAHQLEVLKQWAGERSILFLGYKQFSSIVCDNDTSKTSSSCQEILLTCPSILILDEGHTPRNQDTDVLTSLEKVQTPRKVVLSGTLYQNHVKEVFNILNLVRPKFLKLESSKTIKRRILSRVPISRRRILSKKGTDNEFFELVEHTLLKDDNFMRKATVIQDLREMTSKVLHYYKGDFLDELPGLVDFTVFLNLSPRQMREVGELKKLGMRFKISSDGSAIYVHPQLKSLLKNTAVKDRADDDKIDEMLKELDEREGVKAKFYLNLLRLCDLGGEKMLVFSQYLLPLKFLERLTVKVKGWSVGKEIFMITGDSDSDVRESSMDSFNQSPDARVFFGSIKACGEGISLVGASRIVILDVHLNPSVTRQAIGRAFRPGQERKVYIYRLVAKDSPEEEDHYTCFKKESISKMWFEWNEYCGHQDFNMETLDVGACGDMFLETPLLNGDVVSLYKR